MIIQCEQCRTKFKLDDSKVSERGARVRCAKCRHVFTVRRADTVPAVSDETVVLAAAPAAAVATPPSVAAEPEVAFDFGSQPEASATEPSGFDFGEVSFADINADDHAAAATAGLDDEKTMIMPPPKQESAAAGGIDFGTVLPQAMEAGPTPEISFDFGDARPTTETPQAISFDFTSKPAAVAAAPAGDIDFGGFDFGDVSVAKPDDSFALTGTDFGALAPAASTPVTGGEGDLDFSFGDAAPQAVTAPVDGFDFSNLDFGADQPVAAPVADNVSLGELDFSTEAAAVAVPANDQNAALFAFSPAQPSEPATPSAAAVEEPAVAPPPQFTFEPAAAEEAPPLSIASRRRQSPVLSTLITVVALVVIGGLGYMGYLLLGDGDKPAKLFGKAAPLENGRITVQKVQAEFLTKAAAGDLLIITGEAQNGFSKPRAALQVKGTIFGPNNEPLATQTAYAGNQLTRDQLATMPREKIEAAMNNQFGDSLANLEVAAGKSIPFTLVIINPPANGKEYGVEAVGSTVAASK